MKLRSLRVTVKSDPPTDPNMDPTPTSPPASGPHDASDDQVDADRLGELYKSCNDFETRLQVAIENGLFQHQSVVKLSEILPLLKDAMIISLTPRVSPKDYSDAILKLDTAKGSFAQALVAVGTWKRLLYVYGLPPMAYLLLVLAFDGWVVLKFIPNYPGISFLSMPFQILVAGSVGSVLKGLAGLWEHVDALEYRKIWATWYLLNPFMGALLGGIVYLAFDVGIVVTTSSGVSMTNPILPILVAAIAGYNWKWSRDVLNKVVELFSSTPSQTDAKAGSGAKPSQTQGQAKPQTPKKQ